MLGHHGRLDVYQLQPGRCTDCLELLGRRHRLDVLDLRRRLEIDERQLLGY